jgi:hypothetical protein
MRIIVGFLIVTGVFLSKKTKKAESAKNEDDVPFEGCNDTKFPYLCSNGQCARSYFDCREKAFQCENRK